MYLGSGLVSVYVKCSDACEPVCVCESGYYLVLAGKPGVAEVQALVGFPQDTELPLLSSPFQLGGAQLPPQHGALSQQLCLQRQPLLLVGLQPVTPTRTGVLLNHCHCNGQRAAF